MTFPIKIVGCVVDVHQLTLYKADGSKLCIPQGDPRIKELVAKVVPAIRTNQEYMLTAEDMADRNHFAEAEKKANGFVRFFKMAKNKAKELLDKFVEPIGYIEVGTKGKAPLVHSVNGKPRQASSPAVNEVEPVFAAEEERPLTKSEAAVAEIMANAVHSTDSGFSSPDKAGEEETTVIAVLDDNTVIPGCEALAIQVQSVNEGLGNSIGMENFLRRASMIKRGHSVEDLLKFIQKGELPLADDGCVLAYKLLSFSEEKGVFVDYHTRKVKQRVGSFVHMAEELVDPNRHQDCSNGLHVARRDYLHSFYGNVCMLVKLAPEDVIAVPKYDARKLRAKGYHIIAQLSDEDMKNVMDNRPMADTVLLGNAIAGNHVGITEYVEITGHEGNGVVITTVAAGVAEPVELKEELTSTSLDMLESAHNPEINKVDARYIAMDLAKPGSEVTAEVKVKTSTGEIVEINVTKAPEVKKLNAVQQLVQDFEMAATSKARGEAATNLVNYKKAKKKSWTALGVMPPVWSKAVEIVEGLEMKGKNAVTKADVASKKVNVVAKTTEFKKYSAKVKDVKQTTSRDTFTPKGSPLPEGKKTKMTQQEQMASLVKLYEKNPDKANARAIYAFKQKTKKSWEVLGVTDVKFQKKITERAKL